LCGPYCPWRAPQSAAVKGEAADSGPAAGTVSDGPGASETKEGGEDRDAISGNDAPSVDVGDGEVRAQPVDTPSMPDWHCQYELRGILAHSGTSDSGHYYSFIKVLARSQRFSCPSPPPHHCVSLEFPSKARTSVVCCSCLPLCLSPLLPAPYLRPSLCLLFPLPLSFRPYRRGNGIFRSDSPAMVANLGGLSSTTGLLASSQRIRLLRSASVGRTQLR
jgi:hypothetical protein